MTLALPPTRRARPLAGEGLAILRALWTLEDRIPTAELSGAWWRVRDIGGHASSHHSWYLKRVLLPRGLVERRPAENTRRRASLPPAARPTWEWRITAAGVSLLSRTTQHGGPTDGQ